MVLALAADSWKFINYGYLGYIDEFEIIDDHRSGKIVVHLNGRLNKCGVISPRFSIKVNEMEKWVNKLLPSRQFGHLILTTSYGIMDHETARKKHTGGKILGFFYESWIVIKFSIHEKGANWVFSDLAHVCLSGPYYWELKS